MEIRGYVSGYLLLYFTVARICYFGTKPLNLAPTGSTKAATVTTMSG